MYIRSVYLRLMLVIVFAMAAPRLWAQDGLQGALSQTNFAASLERSLAVADFDDDKKPDGAVLLNCRLCSQDNFRIQLHLTGRRNTELTFQSNQTALELVALDIDHDGYTDVVVQQAFTHKRLHVWINDGSGAFHEQQAQDFPVAALDTRESLGAPANQSGGAALGFPPQRGFEIAGLSILPRLSRPPTDSKFQRQSPWLTPASPVISAHSSRAPPLA
jgi:hypothetical protein